MYSNHDVFVVCFQQLLQLNSPWKT